MHKKTHRLVLDPWDFLWDLWIQNSLPDFHMETPGLLLLWNMIWLVVERTHSEKYARQIGSIISPGFGVKIENIWNHHLVIISMQIRVFQRFKTTIHFEQSLICPIWGISYHPSWCFINPTSQFALLVVYRVSYIQKGNCWIFQNQYHFEPQGFLSGFNPPEKYESDWIISPRFGVKIKTIWNHHLVHHWISETPNPSAIRHPSAIRRS